MGLDVLVEWLLYGYMSFQCFCMILALICKNGYPNIPQMGYGVKQTWAPYQRIQEIPQRSASSKESPSDLQLFEDLKATWKMGCCYSRIVFLRLSRIANCSCHLGFQLTQAMLSGSCFLECSAKLMLQDPSLTTIPYRSSLPVKLQGGRDCALTVELFFRISWMVLKAATVLLNMPRAASPRD